MKPLYRYISSVAVSIVCVSQALAGGYAIPEQGSKATGMGNAFAAVADDASANWYNPAGLSFQKDSAMISGDVIAPVFQYTDPATGKQYTAKKKVFVVPQGYLAYHLRDSAITLGLGINSPFGLSTDWQGSGAPFSRVNTGADSITFSKIQGVHINPNIAYQVSEHLSIAVGLAYYNLNKVHLDSQALNIGGHGDGWGGNAAVMYKGEHASLGLSYRSKVKVNVNGTAVGGPAMAIFGLQGVAGNVSTSLTLPEIISAGVSYQAGSLLMSAQVDRVGWSSFNRIDLNFAPSQLNLVTGNQKSIPENWKDITTYRLGMALALDQQHSLRAGYTYDPTPSNTVDLSPRLPGADRQLVSLGYGVAWSEQVHVDVAYSYIWLKNRIIRDNAKALYNGTYSSTTHLLSAGLSYQF